MLNCHEEALVGLRRCHQLSPRGSVMLELVALARNRYLQLWSGAA
jgi:hypothetical protein